MNLKETGLEVVKHNKLVQKCVQCQALVHKRTFEIKRSGKLLYGLKFFEIPIKYCASEAYWVSHVQRKVDQI
jgi:hypothetical protein